MKTIELKIVADVSDSVDIKKFVSGLQDALLCDVLAHAEIQYKKDGRDLTCEFDNDDWEE